MRKFTLILLFSLIGTAIAQTTGESRKIDRGITKTTFIKKGQWFVGGTASYMSLNASDFQFLLLDNVKAKAFSTSGKILAGYCWKDDIGAGIGFDYNRTMIDLPKTDFDLGEDLSIGIDNFYSIQQVYTGTAFLRTYLYLGLNNRLGMFNDVKLSLGGGQGKITSGLGETMTGSYQKIFNAGLIIQPGISVFITDYVAAEASMGLFGIRYSKTDQIRNQVYKGSIDTFDASFKLNLLSINLGVTFYF